MPVVLNLHERGTDPGHDNTVRGFWHHIVDRGAGRRNDQYQARIYISPTPERSRALYATHFLSLDEKAKDCTCKPQLLDNRTTSIIHIVYVGTISAEDQKDWCSYQAVQSSYATGCFRILMTFFFSFSQTNLEYRK